MRCLRFTLGTLAAAAAALVCPAVAAADVVTDWNRTLVSALQTAQTAPPASGRVAAIVQVSVYDAVNGIARRFAPLHVAAEAPEDASRRAAAASAAHTALVALFPSQQAIFDAQLSATLTTLGADNGGTGKSVQRGLAWGRDVANAILAWRQTDGFSPRPPPYLGGTVIGQWRPTPPAFQPGAFPQLGSTLPFVQGSLGVLSLDGPPALSSPVYAADFNEVKAFGADAAGESREIAFFWRPNSVVTWNELTRDLTAGRKLKLIENARLFALLNVAMADATAACWHEKYRFSFWRPITAIREAASDGNDATEPDSAWEALFPTPNHPDYPSGHATISAAAATVLASIFGEETSFSIATPDPAEPGLTRSFPSFRAASAEANDSRVYAGIHFRSAVRDGRRLGRAVSRYILETAMRRTQGSGPRPDNVDRGGDA